MTSYVVWDAQMTSCGMRSLNVVVDCGMRSLNTVVDCGMRSLVVDCGIRFLKFNTAVD